MEDHRLKVTFDLNCPEGQRLSSYQIERTMKQFHNFVENLPEYARTNADPKKTRPILDAKVQKFMDAGYLQIHVDRKDPHGCTRMTITKGSFTEYPLPSDYVF